MTSFGTRRAQWIRIPEPGAKPPLAASELAAFEAFDLFYRSLCAILYNYVPMSGHPGGSISSGRFVAGLLFDAAEYELARPGREDADVVSYAAGHKAMGLYAMWALRDEMARAARPDAPAADVKDRLRLEDLLGFRRNPITAHAALREAPGEGARRAPDAGDAVRAALDRRVGRGRGERRSASRSPRATSTATNAPRVHVVEGEGGLTPGRVAEALAAASARLARQRRRPRRLEPGLDRLEPRVPRRRRARATTCSGTRWSCSTCTTGTSSRSRTAATSSR